MGTPEDQEAADIALARTLQEQERVWPPLLTFSESLSYGPAYVLLAGGRPEDFYPGTGDGGFGDLVAAGTGGGDEDEDPSVALARALMEEEERDHRARMMAMAGIAPPGEEGDEDEGPDPDEMNYEQLTALGETVGTVSRGLTTEQIASACRTTTYAEHCRGRRAEEEEQCAVCRFEFKAEDKIGVLRCSHGYHPECIAQWLAMAKSCPVCGIELGGGTPKASKPSPSEKGASPQQPSPGRLCPAV